MGWQEKAQGYGLCEDYVDGAWVENPEEAWISWKKPPDLDWSSGYSSLATEADVSAAEADLGEMFPGVNRFSHQGYTPESMWEDD